MTTNGHTAAIYARLSRPRKGVAEDETSVVLQVRRAQEYAARHGWTVPDALIFDQDTEVSGAEFEKRAGLMALLSTLSPAPPFQVLIVRDLDRLAREQYEGGFLLKRLSEAGVAIHEYRNGEVRLNTAIERFTVTGKNLGAELEREQGGNRTRDRFEDKVRKGEATGHAAFGYRNEPVMQNGVRQHVEIQVHEPEAAIVRRIFESAATGSTPRQIAHVLNRDGVPGPKGKPWRGSAVYQIMCRLSYKGVREWGKRKARNAWGKKTFKAQAEWLTVPAPDLRIVDDLLWQRAQAGLAGRSVPPGFSGYHGPTKHVLVGHATCGTCGAGLVVVNRKRKGGRDRFYTCGKHHQSGAAACPNGMVLPLKATDAAVLRAVQQVVLEPAMIDRILDQYTREASDQAASRKRAAQEQAQAEQEIARLTEAVATGTTPVPALVTRLQAAQARLLALQATPKPAPGRRPPISERVEIVRERFHEWRRLDGLFTGHAYAPDRAREVLETLLAGPLAFTPSTPGQVAFRGPASLETALQGLVQDRTARAGMR